MSRYRRALTFLVVPLTGIAMCVDVVLISGTFRGWFVDPTDRVYASEARENQAMAAVKYEGQWRKGEAVETVTSERAEILLNGVWRFVPIANRGGSPVGAVDWGYIQVPGSWSRQAAIAIPGVLVPREGKAWDEWRQGESTRAWYEREILVPAEWKRRAVVLELQRVSTDATVYVNGVACGRVGWPGGEVDITRAVTPGRVAKLRVLVVAAADERDSDRLMRVTEAAGAPSQESLSARGVIGDVLLRSRPEGSHIGDVFVRTSIRRKRIEVAVELRDVSQPGDVRLVARIRDKHDREVKRFEAKVAVTAVETQTIDVGWEWTDPVLWDVGRPNLYTVYVKAQGAGLADEYSQRFGFREVWIDGRRFMLNGTEIRLRPALAPESYTGIGGTRELIDAALRGTLRTGFNIAMLWPWDAEWRGTAHFREVWADRADRLGVPLVVGAGYMNRFIEGAGGRFQWDDPTQRLEFEKEVAREIRRYRNHPSILLYASSGNFFGHDQDQNPRYLGRRDWIADEVWKRRGRAGDEGVAVMTKYDATRPVMMHEGAYVGRVFGINTYLNMIPLQEREEWLTEWATRGEQPFMAVEFGTPLHASMMRGRGGFLSAIVSEPWLTEFAAIYFGRSAYENESTDYRRAIREKFIGGQRYRSWHNEALLDFSANMQAIQVLFDRNTWRSWRTTGITGGMVPWADGHGWESTATDRIAIPYGIGRRGTFPGTVARAELYWHADEGGWVQHPAGRAITENDGATLAWIAGGPSSVAEKTHSFRVGERIEKQIAILNDTRGDTRFSYRWDVWIRRAHLARGEGKGTIAPGTTRLFPVSVSASSSSSDRGRVGKLEGRVVLEATIGSVRHRDEFPFRVFPSRVEDVTEDIGDLLLFDPAGKTGRLLKSLGYRTRTWRGEPARELLLVVGREALSGGWELPGDLEAFVRQGGRVLVFTQQPEWFRRVLGLRVARHVSRRVFPVSRNHPVLRGLDDVDLRDWAGAGTLVEPYATSDVERLPVYGWHWGNRGSVSSAPIEKPHLASWRPILEGEFDLAYSPLMELDYGRGRVILCTLDLEDREPIDPAAEQLTVQLIRYATGRGKSSGKAGKTLFIGSPAEREYLDSLGLVYEEAKGLRDDADLILVGRDVDVDDQRLRSYIGTGRTVLFLARENPRGPLGVTLKHVAGFHGSLDVPDWEWTAGLSASDLRWRTEGPAWVIAEGADIGADGLLAFTRIGRGLAVFSQIDPSMLEANTETFLRFTRWRSTRALVQVLANVGASFEADRFIFRRRADVLKAPASGKTTFYHPDYRADFDLGDDPYRYRRW
jgi:beta-galactosidase